MKKEMITIKKEDIPKMRIPLPTKSGGFHTTKKGKKGYNRKNNKDNSFYE